MRAPFLLSLRRAGHGKLYLSADERLSARGSNVEGRGSEVQVHHSGLVRREEGPKMVTFSPTRNFASSAATCLNDRTCTEERKNSAQIKKKIKVLCFGLHVEQFCDRRNPHAASSSTVQTHQRQ